MGQGISEAVALIEIPVLLHCLGIVASLSSVAEYDG